VFNSGLYAPNGISTMYYSAKTIGVEAKININGARTKNFIHLKRKLVN